MIAWWGWLLVWVGLVLALLVLLGGFAWWLFRKAMTLLDDVAGLAENASLLDVAEPELVRPQLAVLIGAAAVREREAARRSHRAERRRLRHEARLDRAARITRADPMTLGWPENWAKPSQRARARRRVD